MNKAQFWHLITESRQASQGDCEHHASILQRMLGRFSPAEIEAYYDIYLEMDRLAYRNDLRVAANIINGSGSDDGFTDFRAWLISQGESVFYQVLENVDSLADIPLPPDEIAECEQFAYAPLYAYEKQTGTEMARRPQTTNTLVAEDWSDENLRVHYPRLWAKYISDPNEDSLLKED